MIESLKSKQIMLADERNGKIVKNLLASAAAEPAAEVEPGLPVAAL